MPGPALPAPHGQPIRRRSHLACSGLEGVAINSDSGDPTSNTSVHRRTALQDSLVRRLRLGAVAALLCGAELAVSSPDARDHRIERTAENRGPVAGPRNGSSTFRC